MWRNRQKRPISRGNAFRQGGLRCPETVQRIRSLPHSRKPVDSCCGALTVWQRSCFPPICSRQPRRKRSAKGRRRRSNRPGNSQAKGPRGDDSIWKETLAGLVPSCVRRRDNTLRQSDRWGFEVVFRESSLEPARALTVLAQDAKDALKRTPLYALHRALGAKMVPFAGYELSLIHISEPTRPY